MKRILFIACLTVAFLLSSTNRPNVQADEMGREFASCGMTNDVFTAGESLKYSVYYNWSAAWVYAGYATFNVNNATLNDRSVYHIVSEGKTSPKFDWFYKVRDRYETYIDPSKVVPFKFVRDVKEGDFSLQHLYTFKPEQNEVLINYQKTQGKMKVQNKTVSVTDCAQTCCRPFISRVALTTRA